MTREQLKAAVRAAPKTETHLHIEGALPYRLLRAWKPELYPENPYFYAPDFRFESFPKFDEVLLGHALPWFVSPERYHEAAVEIFKGHLAQGVRYVETSFHFPVAGFLGIPPDEIPKAIRAAVPKGLEVRLFAGMLRNEYEGPMRPYIDKLDQWDLIDGVDVHGFEQMPTQPWNAKIWERVRGAGKVTKVHAGEFDGASRVREAIEVLGSTRIQHGVRSIEDPKVVQLAVERGVTFDVCPLSNVRLKVVRDLASHPLSKLMEAGVNCTISTDDPLVFNNTVLDDYDALIDGMAFDAPRVRRALEAGWKVALVSEEQRRSALAEISRLFSGL